MASRASAAFRARQSRSKPRKVPAPSSIGQASARAYPSRSLIGWIGDSASKGRVASASSINTPWRVRPRTISTGFCPFTRMSSFRSVTGYQRPRYRYSRPFRPARVFSTNRSWLSAITIVAPQATRPLKPSVTIGIPGTATPATSNKAAQMHHHPINCYVRCVVGDDAAAAFRRYRQLYEAGAAGTGDESRGESATGDEVRRQTVSTARPHRGGIVGNGRRGDCRIPRGARTTKLISREVVRNTEVQDREDI